MSKNNYTFNSVGEVLALAFMLEEKTDLTMEQIEHMSLEELGDASMEIITKKEYAK